MIDINKERCTGCGNCLWECQRGLLTMVDGKPHIEPDANCMECGHCMATCPENAIRQTGYDPAQVLEYDPVTFDITPEHLDRFMRFKRSVRHFKPDSVPEDQIRRLIETGRYAHTGANRQTARFIVLSGDAKRKAAKRGIELLGTVDPATIDYKSLKTPPFYEGMANVWKRWYGIYQDTGEDILMHGAPHILLAVADKGNAIDPVITLAYMELMGHAMGIGSCFTGFATVAFEAFPEMRELAGLKDNETVGFTMTFGYPDVQFYRTTNRKDANLTLLS